MHVVAANKPSADEIPVDLAAAFLSNAMRLLKKEKSRHARKARRDRRGGTVIPRLYSTPEQSICQDIVEKREENGMTLLERLNNAARGDIFTIITPWARMTNTRDFFLTCFEDMFLRQRIEAEEKINDERTIIILEDRKNDGNA